MKKVALYGGSFNPIHLGHVQVIKNIIEQMDFDEVRIVPSLVTPGKEEQLDLLVKPEYRIQMIKAAIEEYQWVNISIEDYEVKREGISYTIDTVKGLNLEGSITLVIGLDQFYNFATWKSFDDLASFCDLLVTSRPGFDFPKDLNELSEGLQSIINKEVPGGYELKSGKRIQFFPLDEDVSVSSSKIRKKLYMKQNVSDWVPAKVLSVIREHHLFEHSPEGRVEDYLKLTEFCFQILSKNKGLNIRAYNLSQLNSPAEFVIIASGTSTKHTQALYETLSRAIKKEFQTYPLHTDGESTGRWIALDYGNLIVHLFYDFVRSEYRLEELWNEADPIPLKEE